MPRKGCRGSLWVSPAPSGAGVAFDSIKSSSYALSIISLVLGYVAGNLREQRESLDMSFCDRPGTESSALCETYPNCACGPTPKQPEHPIMRVVPGDHIHLEYGPVTIRVGLSRGPECYLLSIKDGYTVKQDGYNRFYIERAYPLTAHDPA